MTGVQTCALPIFLQPTLTSDALTSESGEQVVTFNPTAGQRQLVCSGSQFSGTQSACLTTPVAALIDTRLGNLSRVSTTGVDLSLQYSAKNDYGKWKAGVSGNYILKYVVTQPSGSNNIVNSPGNPLQFRALGLLSWFRNSFGVNAQFHYTNGYHDYVDPLSRHVRPWTTVDTQFSWRLSSGIKLSLTATNLFNVTPPFINYSAGLGFDPEEGSDLGRVVGLDMSWIW